MRLRQPIQRISASTGQVVDEVAELVFRRPKLGDLIAAMDAAGPGAPRGTVILALAARLAGVSQRDLEGLDIEDGMAVIDLADMAMIFVRCRGGVSHHPAEHVSLEDVAAGAEVLLGAITGFQPR